MAKSIVSCTEVADYLVAYVAAYQGEYAHFVKPPPQGGGYPPLMISPFLGSNGIHCYLATDGVAIADYSAEPDYPWYLVGGPALVADYPDPDSRLPQWVRDFWSRHGITGFKGLYRVTSKTGFPSEIWRGETGAAVESVQREVAGTSLVVQRHGYSLLELVQRLTFGALGLALDIHLPDERTQFWSPYIVRRFGFLPGDHGGHRFFSYLEVSPHVERAAWDQRSIPTRVHVDVQRDFTQAFAFEDHPGGTFSFRATSFWPEHFHDRLASLKRAIMGFKRLLQEQPDNEAAFQGYLERYPIFAGRLWES